MRVVAGRFGGRRLESPPGRATRPTSDRVREAVFSLLGPLGGERVLDLYAGSGALGIEALSRGAERADFVERDARAAATIRRNLEALGPVETAVHRRDALAFLRAGGGPYDLVFADPPYSSAARLAGPLSRALPAVLPDEAVIVTESDKRLPLELELPLVDERVYGDTRIALHRGS
ncbi:MAG TPA: 16S rRNA (guanine(966)-N(2))-methyltransferase RsmD [Thermoleophilaceae bacterium]|nr:16S rRNA (guanine(966)-N(2))-methyltransferase RsmD [Thermoleophilaceae bacterium]